MVLRPPNMSTIERRLSVCQRAEATLARALELFHGDFHVNPPEPQPSLNS